MIAAVRRMAAVYQEQFARKPLLPVELAQVIVSYDGMAIYGYQSELDEIRAQPDPTAFVLAILKEGSPA